MAQVDNGPTNLLVPQVKQNIAMQDQHFHGISVFPQVRVTQSGDGSEHSSWGSPMATQVVPAPLLVELGCETMSVNWSTCMYLWSTQMLSSWSSESPQKEVR